MLKPPGKADQFDIFNPQPASRNPQPATRNPQPATRNRKPTHQLSLCCLPRRK